MFLSLLKILYYKIKSKLLPNSNHYLWGQLLIENYGFNAKLGQLLLQNKSTVYQPKATITREQVKATLKHIYPDMIIDGVDSIHVASMGQVFKIEIDKKILAVKMLHPNIKQKLQKELKQIIKLSHYYSKVKRFKFEPELFYLFLNNMLEQETNLIREATNQKLFYQAFKYHPNITIPQVIDQYSNDNVLTQQWIDSTLAIHSNEINNYGIIHFFFEAIIFHQLLHADLNHHNWGISGDRIVVYDYGSTYQITPKQTKGLIKLLGQEYTTENFTRIGIRIDLTSFKDKVEQIGSDLFILFNQELNLQQQRNFLTNLRNKYKKQLLELRSVSEPWILMLMRSLFSLVQFYHSRNKSIPFKKIIQPYINQAKEIKQMKDKNELKVEIKEDDQLKVFLTLPAKSIENIQDFLTPEVLAKINQLSINLDEIVKKTIQDNYPPGIIFNFNLNTKSYKVWIE
jgi:predicted unusual protein kinase regulating ubiquinone biosynthesis (AarF/ABC1/UbiB family)